MCGICGKYALGRQGEVSGHSSIESMTEAMAHRGPDAEGFYESTSIALGHRRLSIIDLSDAGRQPMANESDDIFIVFNGEIYNYLELRDRLRDHSFKSETDTEVVLHLYEEEGREFLQKLRGMFALAIWDERKEQLLLARDRVGQKPLYYAENGGTISFASTITPLLNDPALSTRPNYDAIKNYLTYRYVPSPDTAFEGVRSLEPGQYLIADKNGVALADYWSPSFVPKRTESVSTLKDMLIEKLTRATKLRLRSDVPVGIFLSGGLDSSLITALADSVTADPVTTYSVGFQEAEYDELEYANLVADTFDTDHHMTTVEPDVVSILPELIRHYEQPFGDPSAIPTYLISQIAANDLKVILNGDGGDENFAGYNHFYYDNLVAQFTRIPKPVRRLVSTVVHATPRVGPLSKLHRYVELGNLEPAARYATWMGNFTASEIAALMNDNSPLPEEVDTLDFFRRAFNESNGTSVLDEALFVDLTTYLPEDLLLKVDRASMAHSLEVRSPFLDHEFIEFASRVPSEYKLRYGKIKKWLLKEAARDLLPSEIIDRPKQGFSVPIEEWLRDEMYGSTAEQLEGHYLTEEWFSARYVQDLLADHHQDRANNAKQIWDLLLLSIWWDEFSDHFE